VAITSLAAGHKHLLLVTADGVLLAAGSNAQGQLGLPGKGEEEKVCVCRGGVVWEERESERACWGGRGSGDRGPTVYAHLTSLTLPCARTCMHNARDSLLSYIHNNPLWPHGSSFLASFLPSFFLLPSGDVTLEEPREVPFFLHLQVPFIIHTLVLVYAFVCVCMNEDVMGTERGS
jgi:hypothetical protein